jgi:FKBP-type peptidyl-prolyl cis-trans isomerase (trigger factor)
MQEFLKSEGQTEEEYIEKVARPEAYKRLKASIILSEISDIEKIPLSNEEVDARLQQMITQFQDPRSQADLTKPEARRDIASRMLAEKTISKLTDYASRSAK